MGGYKNMIKISIHAPRAGGDLADWVNGANDKISIHAPRAGGDNVLTAKCL